MKSVYLLLLISILLLQCGQSQSEVQVQNRLIGGPCEGCEAVFEYEKDRLSPVDTIPCFSTQNISLKISGTIYHADGIRPAQNVILYVYHTNEEGIYKSKGNEDGWGKKHGHLRTWLKTGVDGRYTFYTCKPGAYPSRNNPSHIHAIILEPDGRYYYLSDYVFEGDSLLADSYLSNTPRGGSQAVLRLKKMGDLHVAERDITLGENVPGY